MIPAACDYHLADSAEEAIELLGRMGDAKLLAGGHSLIPMMKLRLAQPSALIDIGRIPELRGVRRDGGEIRIGALTPHAESHASEVLRRDCPLISEAAGKIGDPQVRNKGTLGGNIAHADPASDLPAALVALGASIHILWAGGTREVAAADFFTGLLTTALGAGEIITEVRVPVLAASTGCAYLKIEHPASGYAVCGAAAVVGRADDGSCSEASLCFNGVTATPASATGVVETLVGGSLDDDAIAAAVDGHLSIGDPLEDVHTSGEYRVELARVYGQRALRSARDRASG